MSMLSNAAAAPRVPVLTDAYANTWVRSAVLVLAGALFTALCAQIIIPMSPVPMTAQTFAVVLVGATLGARRGMASMLLYVALGFLLPVYADGSSGFHVIYGASGGYLIGFIFAAGAVGWLSEHGTDRKFLTAFASFVIGQLLIFIPGLIVLHAAIPGISWADTIHGGFTVFILGGLVKAAAAGLLMPAAWKFREKEANRG